MKVGQNLKTTLILYKNQLAFFDILNYWELLQQESMSANDSAEHEQSLQTTRVIIILVQGYLDSAL